MSEDRSTNQPTPTQPPNQPMINHDGFEHEDLSPSGPFYFMAGLALLGLVIYLIAFGIYRFLDSYESVHQPPVSPMATPEADTRIVTHEDTQSFPQPRLEENERTELRSFIEDEDRKLATYDWLDKDRGTVRIPIDRAMELIVQRGLPVRPEGASSAQAQSSAAQSSAAAKKQTPKARTTKAAASGN
ncbi:MAG: hypothetical protein ABSG07_01750 [Terriglobales bacterium]|jgi:hypothetical protein